MAKLECEICGGRLITSGDGILQCEACGSCYSKDWARTKVQEINGTVSVEGTVRTQDADFIIRGGVLERYNGNDTDVIIPDSVVEIGHHAFFNCPGIKSITFSNGLQYIGEYCFADCRALKQISLPETVKEIGRYALSGCRSLEIIIVPYQIDFYYDDDEGSPLDPFRDCMTLHEIIVYRGQKKKRFLYRKYNIKNEREMLPAQTILEQPADDHYIAENCGKWYLNFNREFADNAEWYILREQREERKAKNVCQYCGGSFAGFFTLKCTNCGRRKDY